MNKALRSKWNEHGIFQGQSYLASQHIIKTTRHYHPFIWQIFKIFLSVNRIFKSLHQFSTGSRKYLKSKARFPKLYIIIVYRELCLWKKLLETIVILLESQNSTTKRVEICPNLDVYTCIYKDFVCILLYYIVLYVKQDMKRIPVLQWLTN